jgi:LysM repeat protein
MKQLVTFLFVVCFALTVSGQSKKNQEVDIVSHQVQLGESVRLISKKYLVDPAEIYKLNKFAVNGVSEGMVLQIPVPRKEVKYVPEPESQATETNQTPQETQQPVAVEEKAVEKPTEAKPTSRSRAKQAAAIVEKTTTAETTHTVAAKETLYSLSRQYGVSVDAIKESNPEAGKGLKVGQVIRIPAGANTESNAPVAQVAETAKPAEALKTELTSSTSESAISHTVAPKETLYSLSKKYNVTVDEIKQQNAAVLQRGLQVGQVLTIRKN